MPKADKHIFCNFQTKIPPKSGSFHFYHGFTSVVTNISPHSELYLNSYQMDTIIVKGNKKTI